MGPMPFFTQSNFFWIRSVVLPLEAPEDMGETHPLWQTAHDVRICRGQLMKLYTQS